MQSEILSLHAHTPMPLSTSTNVLVVYTKLISHVDCMYMWFVEYKWFVQTGLGTQVHMVHYVAVRMDKGSNRVRERGREYRAQIE